MSLGPCSDGYSQDSRGHTMARTFRPGNGLNRVSPLQYPRLLPEILLFSFAFLMYCPVAHSGFPSVCQETTGRDAPACF